MKRSIQIDILRLVAIVLVLARHLDVCPVTTSRLGNWISELLRCGGWIGVDLFFVLSGFLVSGWLFSEYQKRGGLSYKRCRMRRGFKIYPAFWVLILTTLIWRVLKGEPIPIRTLLCELLFVQNYGSRLWSHNWSLAVEEHFYIILPVVLLAMVRFAGNKAAPFRGIPIVFTLIAVLCLTMRIMAGRSGVFDLYPTHLRIDGLLFGVLLSYYFCFDSRRFNQFARARWKWLICFGCALVVPAFMIEHRNSFYLYTFGLTHIYIGCGLILVAVIGLGIRETTASRAAAFIGSRSYSIYLWHMFAIAAVAKATSFLGLRDSYFVCTGASVVAAILLGICMATLVEYPLLRIRDKLYPSYSSGVVSR